MKIYSLILTLLFSQASLASLPHLELDMSSAEYTRYLNQHPSKRSDETSIAAALKLGMRLSAWIEFENAHRAPDQQIRLTSRSTRISYPVEAPSIYNPARIQERYKEAVSALPASMQTVLQSSASFPNQLPIADDQFIPLARAIDRVYQSAARWKALKPYQGQYANRIQNDVRGYYFLNKNAWDEAKLRAYSTQSLETRANLKSWLQNICLNSSGSTAACAKEFSQAETKDQVAAFYTKYIKTARANWDSFFAIPKSAKRRDLIWTSNDPKLAIIPFNTPTVARIQTYLSTNIEDEWKWENWNLRLNFGSFSNGPRVEFESGVVPHVNGLGGNVITMDSNQSTEEYESQWTIRHEFGHVIGFPDCYHEFYDQDLQAFVNYQLDVSDLMCSRSGNMKERLYTELKRVYYKP